MSNTNSQAKERADVSRDPVILAALTKSIARACGRFAGLYLEEVRGPFLIRLEESDRQTGLEARALVESAHGALTSTLEEMLEARMRIEDLERERGQAIETLRILANATPRSRWLIEEITKRGDLFRFDIDPGPPRPAEEAPACPPDPVAAEEGPVESRVDPNLPRYPPLGRCRVDPVAEGVNLSGEVARRGVTLTEARVEIETPDGPRDLSDLAEKARKSLPDYPPPLLPGCRCAPMSEKDLIPRERLASAGFQFGKPVEFEAEFSDTEDEPALEIDVVQAISAGFGLEREEVLEALQPLVDKVKARTAALAELSGPAPMVPPGFPGVFGPPNDATNPPAFESAESPPAEGAENLEESKP